MANIAHLYVSTITLERPRDHVWFTFKTYRMSEREWGYELVRANGHDTSTGLDPDWYDEKDVIEDIKLSLDHWEWTPPYGWCISEANHVRMLDERARIREAAQIVPVDTPAENDDGPKFG